MSLENNPLLGNFGLPAFDKIKPEHVVPGIRHVLAESEKQFEAQEKNGPCTWPQLFEPLAKISLMIHHSWSPVSHLNGVMNSEELRKAYEEVQSEIVALGLKMNQSQAIYRAMKTLQQGDEAKNLSEGQSRILDSRIQDAELSGIGLEGKLRNEFNDLSQELTQLSTSFANNVLDATKDFSLVLNAPKDVTGLPASYLSMASQSYNKKFPEADNPSSPENGPWLVTLDYPSFVPFMENSKRRDLREKIYRSFIMRAADKPFDNRATINRILEIRQRQASLLGFDSYAQLSLSRKMAESVESIFELEEELRSAAWQPAQRELQDLKDLASEQGEEEVLNWDVAYWAKRLQEKRFQFTDEELRPYFALPRVLDGLFALVKKIFSINVKKADSQVPQWHQDVMFFKIFDEGDKHIASFYLDPYSRPENKRGGAWMDECIPRHKDEFGKIILPVAYLVCNSTPPINNEPSLMTFREVETLFHEFGHGLQHMLTKVDLLEVSGINGIEWDAVELPSQFMENWCYHKPTLMGIAKHYKTDEQMPDELFQKLVSAKTFRSGQLMLRQIQFGLIDLVLHHSYDPSSAKTPFDVQKEVASKTSVLPPLAEDYFLCSFGHIFSGGYAAGYYSYKWAEVLSADAFSAFEDVGLDSEKEIAKVGRLFRDTVLAEGGSKHPLEVFKSFRKRGPSTQALLKHSGLIK
ncbi:MAG: M3 family metallopeptidase [Oligoflexales bacterium]